MYKILLSTDKQKHAKQDMLSIKRIKDHKVLTNKNDILNEVRNFYANLYVENLEQDLCGRNCTNFPTSAQKINKQDQMLHKLSKTVSRKNRQLCEKEAKLKRFRKPYQYFKTINLQEMMALRHNFPKPFRIHY